MIEVRNNAHAIVREFPAAELAEAREYIRGTNYALCIPAADIPADEMPEPREMIEKAAK